MEDEISQWITVTFAVMQDSKQTVMVKKKLLEGKARNLPNITDPCDHERWAVGERRRSQIHAAEMSFPLRMTGWSLPQRKDGKRSPFHSK